MRVLVFESNLMWSSRLLQSLGKLGHQAVLCGEVPASREGASAAIVNLGDSKWDATSLVAELKKLGLTVIAHAGHKERELQELGRDANVDILATNSELTFKLPAILDRVEQA